MAARSLNQREERHLALDYLLRVPMKVLVERYGMNKATIYRTLKRLEVDVERKAS